MNYFPNFANSGLSIPEGTEGLMKGHISNPFNKPAIIMLLKAERKNKLVQIKKF